MKSLPTVRQEGLIVHELPDEVLIYDIARDKAHCLIPSLRLFGSTVMVAPLCRR